MLDSVTIIDDCEPDEDDNWLTVWVENTVVVMVFCTVVVTVSCTAVVDGLFEAVWVKTAPSATTNTTTTTASTDTRPEIPLLLGLFKAVTRLVDDKTSF